MDIAANLLGVILIVTVYALLASPPHPDRSDTMADPTLPFLKPQRDLFPPFSSFYFALAGRVVRWDDDAVLAGLVVDPASTSGNTDQGHYRWQPETVPLRDIDTYSLSFQPERAAIERREPPLDSAHADALIAAIVQDFARSRRAPVFVVYPSGMDAFAILHPLLEEAGLRFRWFAFAEQRPLEVGRYPQQFLDYGIYW